MRFRLLPITVGFTAMLLVSKTIYVGMALLPGSVVSSAEAAPAHEGGEHAAAKPAGEHGTAAAKPAGERPAATSNAFAKPAAAAMPREPSSPPVPVISDAERQLLQDLRGRRQELETREQTLVQRESVLGAAEQRLSDRVGQLTALQTRLESLEKQRQDHDDANWSGLVRVYETMKPREAATIFNEMDMPVLLRVMDRMKDAKAALILGAMLPDRARLVTSQLAAQRTRSTTVPPDHSGAG